MRRALLIFRTLALLILLGSPAQAGIPQTTTMPPSDVRATGNQWGTDFGAASRIYPQMDPTLLALQRNGAADPYSAILYAQMMQNMGLGGQKAQPTPMSLSSIFSLDFWKDLSSNAFGAIIFKYLDKYLHLSAIMRMSMQMKNPRFSSLSTGRVIPQFCAACQGLSTQNTNSLANIFNRPK